MAAATETLGTQAIGLDRVALALSDPIRLRILDLLATGRGEVCCSPPSPEAPDALCACDLLVPLDLSPSKLSYHMKVLHEAGLTTERKRGRWVYYTLQREALAAFTASVEQRYIGVEDAAAQAAVADEAPSNISEVSEAARC